MRQQPALYELDPVVRMLLALRCGAWVARSQLSARFGVAIVDRGMERARRQRWAESRSSEFGVEYRITAGGRAACPTWRQVLRGADAAGRTGGLQP